MRDIIKVIDQILEIIPDSEVDLKSELSRTQRSAEYSAPELMYLWWKRGTKAFIDRFGDEPDLSEDWHLQVLNLWRGQGNE